MKLALYGWKSFRGVAINGGIDKIEAMYISRLLLYAKSKSEKSIKILI